MVFFSFFFFKNVRICLEAKQIRGVIPFDYQSAPRVLDECFSLSLNSQVQDHLISFLIFQAEEIRKRQDTSYGISFGQQNNIHKSRPISGSELITVVDLSAFIPDMT